MAQPIMVPVPIYVDRVKVGEATEGSYEVRNGVETVVTNDGTAFTMGRVTTGVSIKTIVPRAGMRVRLFEAVVSKKDCKIQLPIDGKYHEVEGKFTSAKADWNHASGNCMGDFVFVGGEPRIL